MAGQRTDQVAEVGGVGGRAVAAAVVPRGAGTARWSKLRRQPGERDHGLRAFQRVQRCEVPVHSKEPTAADHLHVDREQIVVHDVCSPVPDRLSMLLLEWQRGCGGAGAGQETGAPGTGGGKARTGVPERVVRGAAFVGRCGWAGACRVEGPVVGQDNVHVIVEEPVATDAAEDAGVANFLEVRLLVCAQAQHLPACAVSSADLCSPKMRPLAPSPVAGSMANPGAGTSTPASVFVGNKRAGASPYGDSEGP